MSRYSKVSRKIWGDAKFRALTPLLPSGQGLWLWLLTTNKLDCIPGMIAIGEAGAAEEIGWSLKAFREAFQEAFDLGMVKADWEARLIWVPNAIQHNPPESPNVVAKWANAWDIFPECNLKKEAYSCIIEYLEDKGEAWAKPFRKPLIESTPKSMPNQEQEQEQEQEQDKRDTSESSEDIRLVFAYWKKRMWSGVGIEPRLTADRRAKIGARLREKFTIDQLCAAVDGCAASAFHMGDNDRQTKYNSIALIFRNTEKVEQFIALKPKSAKQINDELFKTDNPNILEEV